MRYEAGPGRVLVRIRGHIKDSNKKLFACELINHSGYDRYVICAVRVEDLDNLGNGMGVCKSQDIAAFGRVLERQ